MLKLYDKVEDGEPFWTVNDRRMTVWLDEDVESVNFDQKGGLDSIASVIFLPQALSLTSL